jgi:hypothetical protein
MQGDSEYIDLFLGGYRFGVFIQLPVLQEAIERAKNQAEIEKQQSNTYKSNLNFCFGNRAFRQEETAISKKDGAAEIQCALTAQHERKLTNWGQVHTVVSHSHFEEGGCLFAYVKTIEKRYFMITPSLFRVLRMVRFNVRAMTTRLRRQTVNRLCDALKFLSPLGI